MGHSGQGHYIRFCSCGNKISECRCFIDSPKTRIEVKNGCWICRQKVMKKLKGKEL